jgi:hypothetical protein
VSFDVVRLTANHSDGDSILALKATDQSSRVTQ